MQVAEFIYQKVLWKRNYLNCLVKRNMEKSWKYFALTIRTKDEAIPALQRFIQSQENMLSSHVKILNADDSGEIRTKSFNQFLDSKGIHLNFTTKNIPQNNTIAESAITLSFPQIECAQFYLSLVFILFSGYSLSTQSFKQLISNCELMTSSLSRTHKYNPETHIRSIISISLAAML